MPPTTARCAGRRAASSRARRGEPACRRARSRAARRGAAAPPTASAVRPRLPVFQWISGSTRTRCSTPCYSMSLKVYGLCVGAPSMIVVTATRILSRPAGRVVAVRRARLRVARGPSRGATLDPVVAVAIVIGSDPDADLVLADDTVSARHAEVRADAARLGDPRSRLDQRRRHPRRARRRGAARRARPSACSSARASSSGSSTTTRSSTSWRATPFGGLVGDAPAMRALFALVEQAARVRLDGAARRARAAPARRCWPTRSIAPRRAPSGRSSSSTAARSPPTLDRERAVRPREGRLHRRRSRARRRARGGRGRHASSSTRLASCRSSSRSSSCARSRRARCAGSAPIAAEAHRRARHRGDPPAARSPGRCRAVPRRPRTTGSRSSRCTCRPCASAPRTSCRWRAASWRELKPTLDPAALLSDAVSRALAAHAVAGQRARAAQRDAAARARRRAGDRRARAGGAARVRGGAAPGARRVRARLLPAPSWPTPAATSRARRRRPACRARCCIASCASTTSAATAANRPWRPI